MIAFVEQIGLGGEFKLRFEQLQLGQLVIGSNGVTRMAPGGSIRGGCVDILSGGNSLSGQAMKKLKAATEKSRDKRRTWQLEK